MRKKVLSVIFASFFIFSLWGKAPTRENPYENYDSTERSFSSFNLYGCESQKIRDDKTWTVTLYRKSNTDYIVFQFKKNSPDKSDIEKMLEKNQSIWKKYNKDNGDVGLFHIFLDSNEGLIYSARYSEDY